MKTIAVRVTDTVTYERWTTVLIDVEDDADLDDAQELAIERARRGDVDWDEDQVDSSPYEVEVFDEAEDFAEVLRASRRPAGLDHDEQQEFDKLRRRLEVTDGELRRWSERTPIR